MNGELSWKEYLYGESWRPNPAENFKGLIPKLSQRVGLLKQMRSKMNDEAFNTIANGLFTTYCIHVFGNVWFPNVEENTRRFRAFTKKDCNRLQILQNKVLRMKLNYPPRHTSCIDLVKMTGNFSIHQLIAYHTLLQVHKTTQTNKPRYLSDRLILRKPDNSAIFPMRNLNTIEVNRNLTVSRSGFIFRGADLWNKLPIDIRSCDKLETFRTKVKNWIREKVPVKPP